MSFVPLVGGALFLGEIRGGRVPGKTLCSLFADGWGCVSTLFVFWPGASFFKMAASRGVHANDHSLKLLPPMSCPHSEPKLTPAFPGDPPRPAGRSDPDSYGVPALPLDPVYLESCLCPPRVKTLVPPVLCSSCAHAPLAFNAQFSRGSS